MPRPPETRFWQAFELAEAEDDPARHRDLRTFILVGAGPTGVRNGRRLGRARSDKPEIGVPPH